MGVHGGIWRMNDLLWPSEGTREMKIILDLTTLYSTRRRARVIAA